MTHDELKAGFLEGLSAKRTNLFRLTGNLIDRVRDGFTKYGCDRRDDIIEAAKDAYFALAAAIDIPLVPAVAEQQIEQNLWDNYVAPTLEAVAASICGPKTGESE